MSDDLISRQLVMKTLCERRCGNKSKGCPSGFCTESIAVDCIPSAQPEHRFNEWCTDCKEYDHERHCCPRFNQVIRTTLQEVQEERKKGKWILKPNIYGVAYCSECDYELHTNNTNYCPNCGADMRGEQNE